jgi:hypothetical protein
VAAQEREGTGHGARKRLAYKRPFDSAASTLGEHLLKADRDAADRHRRQLRLEAPKKLT